MRHIMYVYPWDLHEEGADRVAGRLRDAGLNAVALSVSYHAGKFLRPHAPRRKVYFPEDGTVYFSFDPSRYRRLVPLLAQGAREFDALAALERHAPDLDTIAWTVGLHNSRLGVAHPDLAAQTPFGDPLINSLCPAQPEVRHYLTALCADIAARDPICEVAIETPGWQAFRHGHHHEFELVALPPRVEILMGMCFCDACRAGARADGIDAGRLADNTVLELERFFVDGTEPATDPQTDPDWAAFHAWRARSVTDLVKSIRAEISPQAALAVIPTVQTPNDLCWIEGSDLRQLAHAADRLEVPAYQRGVAAIEADVSQTRASAGAEADIGFILRPTYPHLSGAEQVAQAVQTLRRHRATSISFYNYGHMRLQSLDWIRQALS